MKTLTIKQPWASLIAHGIKDIENRTWRTNFRGRIYVHAGAQNAIGMLSLLNKSQVKEIRKKSSLDFEFTKSAIIGEVDIVDCVMNHPSIWAEKTEGVKAGNQFFYKDRQVIWNWVLANPVLYDQPILNVKGALSLWEYRN